MSPLETRVGPSGGRLPDFVIIGATKSATTWLQRSLQEHPRVFMPDPEVHYFSREFDRGQAWYQDFFREARPGQIIGEKSNSYLEHPQAPHRLHRALPDARLIAQLRNPIQRAYTDYCMLLRRGEVGRDLDRYLDPRRTPLPRFLEGGLYYTQLCRFLELFSRERLLILLHDELKTEPAAVVRKVCGHLGLEAPASIGRLSVRVKDSTTPIVPPTARRLLAPLKDVIRPLRGTAGFQWARSLLARPMVYPELTPSLRDRLRDYYREDVAGLGRLLGRDLGAWLAPDRAESSSAAGAEPSAAARPVRPADLHRSHP
ncbi:MAG: sulfotransferase family protein [Geminicoccaceae bacterium]